MAIFPQNNDNQQQSAPTVKSSNPQQVQPIFPVENGGTIPNVGIFANPNRPENSAFWDAIDVMNKNFADVANGSLQFMAKGIQQLGIDTSGAQRELALQQQIHQQDYDMAMRNSPIVGTITDIGSKIGAAIATPGTQPLMAAQGANVVARMGQAGLAGGIVGGSQYVPEDSETGRFENAMTGAAFGAGAQGVAEGVGALAKTGAKKLFSTQQNVDEAAQAYNQGARQSPAMATGNKALQGAELMMSDVPVVGTKGRLVQQADDLSKQTFRVLDDLGVNGKVNKGSIITDTAATAQKPSAKDLLNQVYKDSVKVVDDGVEQLNLKSFTDNLNSVNDVIGELPKAEQLKVKGLQKVLNRGEYLLEKAADSGNTVAQLGTIGGLGAGALTDMGTTALLALATKGLSSLLTSSKTTKALIKLAGGKLAQTGTDGLVKSMLKEGLKAGMRLAPSALGTSGEQQE